MRVVWILSPLGDVVLNEHKEQRMVLLEDEGVEMELALGGFEDCAGGDGRSGLGECKGGGGGGGF